MIWSSHEPCRAAAQTPMGTPTATPIMMPMVAISSVAGKTCLRSSTTRFPVETETPRSPDKTERQYQANCSISGLSSPRASRVASYTSLGARSPTTAITGSIGITRPMKKVIARSPRKVRNTEMATAANPCAIARSPSRRDSRPAGDPGAYWSCAGAKGQVAALRGS